MLRFTCIPSPAQPSLAMSSTSTRKSVKDSGNAGVLTGRRKRQETLLTIRKAKKEDAYATRRNLKANLPHGAAQAHPRDADSRRKLLENIAARSQALLLGIQHKDPATRQKSMRAFVYLLSSGVPPLFDETHSQHVGLWNTIVAAIPSFVAILDTDVRDANSVQLHSDSAFALRFIASMEKATVVIQAGAVPKLVQLFQCGITELQVQAAWCLGNIASESAECCEAILASCPPTIVLPHIRMSAPSLRRAAVWLLRSLIEFPDVMARCGALTDEIKREIFDVLTNIIAQLAEEKVKSFVATTGHEGALDLKQNAAISSWRIFERIRKELTWYCVKVNTGKPAPNDIAVVRFVREVDETSIEVVDVDVNFETGESQTFVVKKSDLRAMQVLEEVADDDDEEDDAEMLDEKVLTLCDSCWSLVELTVHDADAIAPLVASGLCTKLVELLFVAQSSVILAPVLRLIGNIVSAEISFTQAVIDAQLLEVMPRVLSNSSRSVREEACWILSNIAGDAGQVDALTQRPAVMNGLVEQMAWAEFAVKREATWALCNVITRATAECIVEMVRLGVLQHFSPLLDEVEDAAVELVILQAIESLLTKIPTEGKIYVEESGCLSKIEDLCFDANEDLSAVASHIMDTWFGGVNEEEADTSMGPAIVNSATAGEGQAFSFQPVQSDVTFHFGGTQS
ncbi:TPA: hypothetical protein N0F65_003720 [Lagenidium giganteum]|uniref:IBB domain-containing protein n=1 Tax=Lagenidium giganteum TaxID=4803 RepID=A0AAV2Z1Z3_9STRA|nr:TPA: hypothetical protein N0F65_003720 [Lagenidium giganteum]